MINKLAAFVTSHPKLILLLSVILLIPGALGFFATDVNYDILSYLPDDIESVTSLDILDKNFQFAASSIVILENMKARDVVKVKQQIEDLECVVQVLWTDSVLDISVPVDILPDIAKDVFYSKDGDSTLFIVQYSTGTSDDVTLEAVKEIRSILNEQCFISGISATVADVKALVESEAIRYVSIAVIVALITLAFTMETLFMPLALFFALACAVVYNMGTNFFLGEISFVTQCVAAVLQLGVTMDYSIFLIDRFEEEKIKTPEDKKGAMQRAIKTSFVSLLSSSLTTVFGFLALCFMSLTIGFDLGIVMAKGVVLGISSVLIVLPCVLLQFNNILEKFKHKRLLPKFDKISAFTLKHKKVFAILFIVLIVPSFIAKDQMGIYYNIIKALPDETPSLIALDKMKEDFDMASTHFLVLPVSTPAKNAEKIMKEIEQLDGIEDVLALNTLLGSAIDTSILPEIVNDLCHKDGYSLAMINSIYDAGSPEANVQVANIRQIIARYSDGGMSTGEAVLMADLAKTADSDLILTSAISILAIMILIMIAFKSFSLPLILVASIELAIFINQTITWIMGTEVTFITPIIISCVQLGATVDYAILVTSRYKEYLASGLNNDEAAEKASATAMHSVFQSALVFFTVTGSLAVISEIKLITELCTMLARGSLISAVVILFLLAPTLSLSESFIKKTSLDWPLPNPLRRKPNWEKQIKTPKHTKKVPAMAVAADAEGEPKKAIPERRYVQPLGTIPEPPKRTQPRAFAPPRPAQPMPPQGMPPRPAQPMPPQGMPPRPAQPMPPQGMPPRPGQPMPPQGMPPRPAQPMHPQGMPPRPGQPMPPQGMPPRPGVPVRTAQVPPQGRPVMPPPQGYPVYPPFPGPMSPHPAQSQPASNPKRQANRPNYGRVPNSPDPFEVNPYANKPYSGKKEDK